VLLFFEDRELAFNSVLLSGNEAEELRVAELELGTKPVYKGEGEIISLLDAFVELPEVEIDFS